MSKYGYDKHPLMVPIPFTDLGQAVETLRKKVHTIKSILFIAGLAPDKPTSDWDVPVTENQLTQAVNELMWDVCQIENLLAEQGLADEDTFLPLESRYRIDPVKHHNRNFRLLWKYILSIVWFERHYPDMSPPETSSQFRKRCEQMNVPDRYIAKMGE